MGLPLQTTLKSAISFDGVGLHSGAEAKMTLLPAGPGFGIWFQRTDIVAENALIQARWDKVNQSPLCTKIENDFGASISTIEHIMAALMGCGVHNALIEVNGPEVPILDGSAAIFVRAILEAGLEVSTHPVQVIEVLKPVEVRRGEAVARLEPASTLEIDFKIEFEDEAIGSQRKTLRMNNGSFVRELCDSRTFCRQADVDAMRAQGLARGGSLLNAVVVDGASVLSPGGLRHTDEAVRHKMLDALGDLALAGAPIFGRYLGVRSGHALTNDLLRSLFADPTAYRVVDCSPERAARLPGAGVNISEMSAVA